MIRKTNKITVDEKLRKNLPTVEIDPPEKVYITLIEMRLNSYELDVKEGDKVKLGECIGVKDGGFFTENIFSTVSGTVGQIVKKFNYSGKKVECLEIINDFQETKADTIKERTDQEIAQLTKDQFVDIIKDNGIKGLGGGGFPTYIKFATDAKIETIVLNGIECEPYMSADYQLVKKNSYEIFGGLKYAMNSMGISKGIIGVKETKKALLKALRKVQAEHFSDLNCEIIEVQDYYPQGWELELIKNVLGIKIKQGTLLSDYGLIEINVTTAVAIYNAVKYNHPVVERYFTITGTAVNKPCQMKVKVGEYVPRLIEAAGGYKTKEDKILVLGGPMMGANLLLDDAIIAVTNTSILVFEKGEPAEEPCIRCASCVYSCPTLLQPVQIMNAFKCKDIEAIKKLKIFNCIECGLCSYVCTSKIHLTEYMRKAKKLAK